MGICPISYAGGIRVSPGAFCLQGMDIGQDADLGVDLVISNLGDTEDTFVVKPIKPSQAKKNWLKGYSEIPDASWLYFKEDRVKIGPNSEGKLRMHLKIPEEERYLNQHWMVYVEVTTEATDKMFKVGVKPNYMIETTSKERIKERPHGVLGLAPTVLKATEIKEGKGKKVKFRIYNNDEKVRTYTFTSYIPEASQAKQDISITPGYEWVKDPSWVVPGKAKVKVKPGEEKTVALNILIPKGSEYQNLGWEGIVFVEPDEGRPEFLRVQIEKKGE
ncbi:MAG: hypothetical protein AB1797_03650 [bacterium]